MIEINENDLIKHVETKNGFLVNFMNRIVIFYANDEKTDAISSFYDWHLEISEHGKEVKRGCPECVKLPKTPIL
jgi:hypothetical protein